ncbi:MULTISPECIES: PAS domain-containing protein [unclassified Rhizobium]|uniref:PAS domain-containing protein n=1 Tax=unclassified Rhizobium TaxID=2613769 RepID=UPI001ADD0161|nr:MULTISPECIES: PAS domain-containing protein [unclassified Rhizobium]MBO9101880.1 PAS domain-containing protein [Rhizobium sp. L58/93]MBO9172051.1 PAS domain-containing protein [Rhizobium sp. L245/93]QXZ88274.1 PAS domain-containing protein [Rhizobium sp. K1/93]QXZ94245.1 PAS domain-containing protein [Rhizobium sp. K15/93]QYA05665.1 PAS domain-containing protein [Rhizobium sp. B21/90]
MAIAGVKWRMLPNGKIISLLHWEELSGQTFAEADEWGWLEAIHPDERAAARSHWAECIKTGHPYAMDLRVRGADGIYRQYLARGAPVYNTDGAIREWIGVLIGMAAFNWSDQDRGYHRSRTLNVAHIRAARALLDWSIEDLAARAEVSVSTIQRLERDTGKSMKLQPMEAVCKALENGGVCFGLSLDGQTTISLAKGIMQNMAYSDPILIKTSVMDSSKRDTDSGAFKAHVSGASSTGVKISETDVRHEPTRRL